MARLFPSLAVAAALICLSAAPQQAAPKPDSQAIRGTWKWVSVHEHGRKMPWPDSNRLVITSDFMNIVYPKKEDSMGWKYTIDPSKAPRQMDWFPEEEPGHPIHQMAIYSLEGDTLKIFSNAAGKPRPTQFQSKPGDWGDLWVLQRVITPRAVASAQ